MHDLAKIIRHFTYQIYSINDLANAFEINNVVETFEEQKKYFDTYNFSVDYTLANIADYYIVKKICYFRNYLDRVVEEKKKSIENIINYYEDIIDRFEKKRIALFYKRDYNFEHNKDYIGLISVIYGDLPYYISMLAKDTYERAATKHPYLILHNMDKYNKILKKYPELYQILFSEENLKNYMLQFDAFFVEEFSKICHPKSNVEDEIKDRIICVVIKEAKAILSNEDLGKALHNQIKYKYILQFLRAIEYKRYAFYRNKMEIVDNLCKQWVEKDGVKYSYKIPLEEIRKYVDNDNIMPNIKQITLTHLKSKNELVHFCHLAMNEKRSIIDCVSTTQDCNENFRLSVQESLEIFHQFYGSIFNMYLCDEKHFNNYVKELKQFIEYIYSVVGKNVLAVNPQVSYWENGLNQFIEAFKRGDKKHDAAISCADNTVKLIERILRDIGEIEYEKNMIFYIHENMTITNLLRTDINNPLVEVLTVPFMRYVSYCLTQDIDAKGKKAGLNIRNNIMHANIDFKNYDVSDTFICVMLLTGIVNQLFIYYNKKVEDEQNKIQIKQKDIEQTIKKHNTEIQEIDRLQREETFLRSKLKECYNKLIEMLQVPVEYKTMMGTDSNQNIDTNLRKKIFEFLEKEIREKLGQTKEYDDFKKVTSKYLKTEDTFNTKIVNYFLMLSEDRERLFSKEYFNAIDELAEEGLFHYNLKTPDIPEEIIYNYDRVFLITEYYSLDLRNIYRETLSMKNELSQEIETVIDYIEDEEYVSAVEIIFKLVQYKAKELKSFYDIFINQNNRVAGIEYYNNATDKILKYCEKVFYYDKWDGECINHEDLMSANPKHKVNKFDCISLLLMFDNIRELCWLYGALIRIK